MTAGTKLDDLANAIRSTMDSAKKGAERLEKESDDYKTRARAPAYDLESMKVLIELARKRESDRREQIAVYVAMKNLLTLIEK